MDETAVALASRLRPDADLLVAGCFEDEPLEADGLGEAPRRALARLAARPGWRGREDQTAETEVAEGGVEGGTTVVALHGLGKRAELTGRRLAAWIGRAAEAARVNGRTRPAFLLPRHPETTGGPAAERVLRALALAPYRFDRYRSEPAALCGTLERIAVVPPAGEEEAYGEALAVAVPVAGAVAFVRDLANSPANEATPEWIEERARELAAGRGLKMTALGREELERRGMGGLLAVGAGSAHEPRLLRLEWDGTGEAGAPGLPTAALVGKGVTFDSGGISIKPAESMEDMKFDKSGACAVLGILRAAADLALPVRLRGYLPLAENMLDGRSYRPGDIVRCYNGKTVEVLNTDAEGRIILADALAWAAEEGAGSLVEYSTLTGGCVVALGHLAAGLFTPDEGLAGELLAASGRSGERLWRLPLWPEYLEAMKGTYADLRNTGGRWGSASTAAAFLSQFVGDLARWAHLDIAGVAHTAGEDEEPKGATGFGVAVTIDWLRRLARPVPPPL